MSHLIVTDIILIAIVVKTIFLLGQLVRCNILISRWHPSFVLFCVNWFYGQREFISTFFYMDWRVGIGEIYVVLVYKTDLILYNAMGDHIFYDTTVLVAKSRAKLIYPWHNRLCQGRENVPISCVTENKRSLGL